jgi:hypothetical protein
MRIVLVVNGRRTRVIFVLCYCCSPLHFCECRILALCWRFHRRKWSNLLLRPLLCQLHICWQARTHFLGSNSLLFEFFWGHLQMGSFDRSLIAVEAVWMGRVGSNLVSGWINFIYHLIYTIAVLSLALIWIKITECTLRVDFLFLFVVSFKELQSISYLWAIKVALTSCNIVDYICNQRPNLNLRRWFMSIRQLKIFLLQSNMTSLDTPCFSNVNFWNIWVVLPVWHFKRLQTSRSRLYVALWIDSFIYCTSLK